MSSSALGTGRRHVARSAQSFTSTLQEKQTPSKVTKPPSLARRLLFPNLHPDANLPPLLVSVAATPELNDELYNFIAIAMRAYVHPWWTKITRYDKEFLPSITRVLAVVIRALEARVVRTDLSPLILRDLPNVLSQHYQDYRNAQSKLHTSYAAGGAATLSQLFHQAQPHMAVSADGTVDEAYVRQAMDDVLKGCLPSEDYEAEPERYIIREILVKVILGGVIPRLTQPWFIHQQILGLLGADQHQENVNVLAQPSQTSIAPTPTPLRTGSSYTLQSFVIFLLSAIRSFSGACLAFIHAYRHTLDAIKKVNQADSPSNRHEELAKPKDQSQSTLPGSLMPLTPVPPPASVAMPISPPSPPPSPPGVSRSSSMISSQLSSSTVSAPPARGSSSLSETQIQPNYVHPALNLLNTLLTPITSPRSTPLAVIHILTLLLTPFTSLISRLLPYLLYIHVLSPASLIIVVQSAKGALFPGGWPAVPPPDPTPEEQAELRRAVVRHLIALVPSPLVPVFGTTSVMRAQSVDAILEPLSSAECNSHLMMLLLDLILLTLFPEMGIALPGNGAAASLDGISDPIVGDGLKTPRGSLESNLLGPMTPPS